MGSGPPTERERHTVTVVPAGAPQAAWHGWQQVLGEQARVSAASPSAGGGPWLGLVGDVDGALAALDAGAAGALLHDVEPAVLLAAVRAAAAGCHAVDPRLADAVAARTADGAGTGPVLSPREREVLHLVAEGLLNKQIARRLGITTATVKSHLTHVYARLGVDGRAGAAAWLAAHDDVTPAAPAR